MLGDRPDFGEKSLFADICGDKSSGHLEEELLGPGLASVDADENVGLVPSELSRLEKNAPKVVDDGFRVRQNVFLFSAESSESPEPSGSSTRNVLVALAITGLRRVPRIAGRAGTDFPFFMIKRE